MYKGGLKLARREADFTSKVRDTLAKRCGFVCSNPSCRKRTIGSHSDINKAISIGKASHIEAASEGGCRYNENMTM